MTFIPNHGHPSPLFKIVQIALNQSISSHQSICFILAVLCQSPEMPRSRVSPTALLGKPLLDAPMSPNFSVQEEIQVPYRRPSLHPSFHPSSIVIHHSRAMVPSSNASLLPMLQSLRTRELVNQALNCQPSSTWSRVKVAPLVMLKPRYWRQICKKVKVT